MLTLLMEGHASSLRTVGQGERQAQGSNLRHFEHEVLLLQRERSSSNGPPEVLKQVVHETSASAIEEAGVDICPDLRTDGGRNEGATREEEEELSVIDSGHRFMCAIEVTSKRTVCDTQNLENHW